MQTVHVHTLSFCLFSPFQVKAEVQSERDNKAHLVSAFNQEQQKVADLERQLKAQSEASKQESLKMQNANRVSLIHLTRMSATHDTEYPSTLCLFQLIQ